MARIAVLKGEARRPPAAARPEGGSERPSKYKGGDGGGRGRAKGAEKRAVEAVSVDVAPSPVVCPCLVELLLLSSSVRLVFLSYYIHHPDAAMLMPCTHAPCCPARPARGGRATSFRAFHSPVHMVSDACAPPRSGTRIVRIEALWLPPGPPESRRPMKPCRSGDASGLITVPHGPTKYPSPPKSHAHTEPATFNITAGENRAPRKQQQENGIKDELHESRRC